MFIKLDSGFQSLVGFRIPSAGFWIPKPRIPDSTTKKFPYMELQNIEITEEIYDAVSNNSLQELCKAG